MTSNFASKASNTMSKLPIAFIGVGDVATRDYLPEFHRIADRTEIVAMCGRTPERVAAVAREYGAAPFTDYRQMLAECGAEAVVNLTPVQLHAETNLAAIAAGKHLYSEKTFAATVAEASALEREATARGLTVVCAPCVLLWPQYRRAEALLAEAAIGEVFAAHASLPAAAPPWGGYTSDPGHFFARGAGPVKDMGVYALHALTGLLGPVRRVSAFAARTIDQFTPEDGPARGRAIPVEVPLNWQLILEHGGGRLSSLTVNFCTSWESRAPQLELIGTAGALGMNLIDVAAPLLLLRSGSAWEELAVPISGRAGGPDHIMGVEHLAACVAQGRMPLLSMAHAIHVLDIIESAERSAEEGCAVTVATSFTPAEATAALIS